MAKITNYDDEGQELAILKGAVENANEAFVTIDENHKVLFFNQAAERVFGYSRDEVTGNDLDVILTSRCSKEHHLAVDRYLKSKRPKMIGHAKELVATRKSGETFPAFISFSVAEIRGKSFFTGIVRDLTESKALQEQISQSERLAALGQVVAEITHEIKNPLMLIGGFARQLIKKNRDDQDLSKLNIISEEVKRLENLLSELREFYLPRNRMIEQVNINDLLVEVNDLTKADCAGRNIRLRLKTDADAGLVEGEREKLKQVFMNLLKNAIEAMEHGGNISIQSKLSGHIVDVTIADDGPGISREDQEKIFTPFFTTKKHGTGLGLSVSKRILDDHEGCSFSLTSQEGKGTIVNIKFHQFQSTSYE